MQTERQNTFTFTFVEIEMNCNVQLWLLIGPIKHIITLTLSRTQRCIGALFIVNKIICNRRALQCQKWQRPADVKSPKIRLRSSVPDETLTVTKRLWLRKASHPTLLMQTLVKHSRRGLNGSSVPRRARPTCRRWKSVDGDDHRRRRFDEGCRRYIYARCREGISTPKHIERKGSALEPAASGAHVAAGIRDPIYSPKDQSSSGIQDWLKSRQKWSRHTGEYRATVVSLTDHKSTDQCQKGMVVHAEHFESVLVSQSTT